MKTSTFVAPAIKSKKEKHYIRKRQIKAFFNSVCFYLCRIFPIDDKLVSACTFEGKGGFGCNPKYLVQELHKQDASLKFVWFVNPDVFEKKQFPDYIKKVPNTVWSRAYWLSRSRVWIDNYRKPYGTVKRKRQYYLNVNHYTLGIKCVGLWRGEGFSRMAYLVSKNDSDMIDDLVIDSKFCEEMCPKGLVYESKRYLKTGAPRCDILYGDRTDIRKKYRKEKHLPEAAKIVMFAPTFREGAKNGVRSVYSEIWSIDFKRLLKTLEKKFGGEWHICIRVHPQLAPVFSEYKNEAIQDRILDESQADDMYEIMAAMDAYISDYSSACFEAGYAHIPVFLYADDIARYTKDRGSLLWDIGEDNLLTVTNNKCVTPGIDARFPFTIATDNEMLEKNILDFDKEEYDRQLDTFHQSIGLVFEGNAGEKLARNVLEKMKN